MLTIKDVTIKNTNPYGLTPTFAAEVEFQVGERSFSTVKIKLPPEAAREVVELAVAKATGMLHANAGTISIDGEEPAIAEAPESLEPPEFAEVDEAPTAPELQTEGSI